MTEQPPHIPDRQLLRLLQDERAVAFEHLYERYWKRLCSYASRFFDDPDLGEDLVQEVLISLWERPCYREIRDLQAYLFTSVRYKIYNHYRRTGLQRVQEDLLVELPSEGFAEKELEYREFKSQVLREIKQLPPRCRKVFLLSRLSGLSNGEISERLKISIRTVESHISTALQILRTRPVVQEF